MKVAIFTSCHPRHVSLVEHFSRIANTVYVCIEATTLFSGKTPDLYRQSDVMAKYFERVVEAERVEFGVPRFLPANTRTFCMKTGDLSQVELNWLGPALDADLLVVFGASYIRGALAEILIQRRAINIHMGTAPYYRGSSCNFWALFDGQPQYVGATIHRLGTGLDSGPILFHALPTIGETENVDGFTLGMRAVRSAFESTISAVESGLLETIDPVKQDGAREIRYSRKADFTDEVVEEYLHRDEDTDELRVTVNQRDASKFTLLENLITKASD